MSSSRNTTPEQNSTKSEMLLSDRLRKTLIYNDKSDSRELNPNPTTSTSTSSSSSGSLPGRKSASNPHSGELLSSSVESSFKPGHTRSNSAGSYPLIYSGSNICPRGGGQILKPIRASKPDVLGSGSANYGHGSILRGGGLVPKPDSFVKGGGEELKRMGNDFYKRGLFVEALGIYDKAIALSPGNAAYRFNRAAALMGLRRLVEAVRECDEAIRLDPGYVRAHHRLGSLLLSLGEVENARKHICFSDHPPDPMEIQKLQSVEKHIIKCSDARKLSDWKITLREVDAAIASGADASPKLCACRAETLLKLNQLKDAILAVTNIPKSELSTNLQYPSKIFGMLSEAYIFFVRTQIELAKGRFDSAVTAIEKAGQLDPQNLEITVLLNNTRLVVRARARGNDLFKSERYTEACSAYGEGIKLDPLNSVLYCNRAACWFKLRQWEKSVDDCNQALQIQPNYIKALLRRAASHDKLEHWSEAVKDYDLLKMELPHDKQVAESLFHAHEALKKSCREEVHDMKFSGVVELVSGLEQFQAVISSPGVSVVHFKTSSSVQCNQLSLILDTLCTRFPSISFLKVDIEEIPIIAHVENVKVVPTFKIYKKGTGVKEIVCPTPEILESSVRHYI